MFVATPAARATFNNVHRMCRDILSSCVRNTEEAEKSSGSIDGSMVSGINPSSRRAAVWGMIDESELAKTIRRDFDKVRSSYQSQFSCF